jgi:hypothetical protein
MECQNTSQILKIKTPNNHLFHHQNWDLTSFDKIYEYCFAYKKPWFLKKIILSPLKTIHDIIFQHKLISPHFFKHNPSKYEIKTFLLPDIYIDAQNHSDIVNHIYKILKELYENLSRLDYENQKKIMNSIPIDHHDFINYKNDVRISEYDDHKILFIFPKFVYDNQSNIQYWTFGQCLDPVYNKISLVDKIIKHINKEDVCIQYEFNKVSISLYFLHESDYPFSSEICNKLVVLSKDVDIIYILHKTMSVSYIQSNFSHASPQIIDKFTLQSDPNFKNDFAKETRVSIGE